MSAVIGEIVGFAVGIAISPIPIAAVILMLFAERARLTGSAFLLGWIVGIALVVTVTSLLPGLTDDSSSPSTTVGVVKGLIGVALVVLALRKFRHRPRSGEESRPPKWMERVDSMGGGGAIGLALVLTVLNPKNLVLAAAAGATIGAASLSSTEATLAIVVFTAIASLTIVIPVVGYLIAGARIQPALDDVKGWLMVHNDGIMAVLFIVFGAILIGDAISILG